MKAKDPSRTLVARFTPHTALNATDDETVIVATFYEAPEQGPLLIPAETPADCSI